MTKLVTNYGEGGYKTEGGSREVLTLWKGGGGRKTFTVLAMLKGGHKKFWGSFYAVAWSFSHIEGGGGKKCPIFKRGGGDAKSFTVLRDGRKKLRPRDFPIL